MSVSILCFSEDEPRIGEYFARAYLAAPDMTLAVLPALRKAAKATTKSDYIAGKTPIPRPEKSFQRQR
jgi:hypothetical protein